MREIAGAAGWQMGTLYLYISQKEDVLYLISQAIMDRLSDGLTSLEPKDNPLDQLRDAMEYFFDAVDNIRNEIRLLYRESASLIPPHLQALKDSELREREYFANLVDAAIEQGLCRPVDATLFAHNIIFLAHMWALKKWAQQERGFEDYKRAQMDFLWEALTGSPLTIGNKTPAASS